MTKDDIIRMAREAGLAYGSDDKPLTSVIRFAALVAVAEREAILPMLKGIDCTEIEDQDGWWETSVGADFGASILAAIRARGQQ